MLGKIIGPELQLRGDAREVSLLDGGSQGQQFQAAFRLLENLLKLTRFNLQLRGGQTVQLVAYSCFRQLKGEIESQDQSQKDWPKSKDEQFS